MRSAIDLTDLTPRQFAVLFAAFFIVAAIPILAVETLPLLDYPNHLARMRILADHDRSAILRQYYALDWRPIPNLAMDLIVPPLARIMPLAAAGKVFILVIFLLIAGGAALLHRVLFGRWSAWSLLAFLLLYNRILLWGFLNFLFGVGLVLVATALWIGLRDRSARLRLPLAALLATAIYLAHLFAFGVYVFVVLGYEAARLRRSGRFASAAGLGALCAAFVPLLPALAIFLATRGSQAVGDIAWSRFVRKLDLFYNIVDNYDPWFDIASFILLVAVFVAAAVGRALTVSRVMVLPLALLCLAQLAMPNRLFGGTGVDHRMPLVLALVLIGASDVALRDLRRQRIVAALLAALFIARIAVVATTWIGYDRIYAPIVAAFAALPPGARLAVASPPASVHVARDIPPMIHIASIAVVVADAFVPTLFALPGQQPLALREPYAALARSASPEDFWAILADGATGSTQRAAAVLAGYDFIFATADPPVGTSVDSRLALRADFTAARLYAVRH